MRSFGTQITGNRRLQAELSPEARSAIIVLTEEGISQRKLAARFGCSRSTIQATIDRWKLNNTVQTLPRTGRPGKFNARTWRSIYRTVRRTPKITYYELQQSLPTPPSHATITRFLNELGIHKRPCKERPKLEEEHIEKRLQFAQRHADTPWRRDVWMVSDECSIEVGCGQNREWVFRFDDEKWDHNMIQEQKKGKTISQMVWGCFWVLPNGQVGRTPLIFVDGRITALRYCEYLEEGLLPFYQPGWTFQQDNASVHTALITRQWFEEHGISVLEWPPYSPDLNPIEHVWYLLKRMIWDRYPHLRFGHSRGFLEELAAAISTCWEAIPDEYLRTLYYSLDGRVEAVLAANGRQTKY
jgi:transposase